MTDTADQALAGYRREIDEIDDQIRDLLGRRMEIVDKVGAAKAGDGIKLRPGREAQILRRLMAQNTSDFPNQELARIWRELLGATTRHQGPFSVALFAGNNPQAYWDIARDHFGSFAPIAVHETPRRIIELVGHGGATVGVLPLPALDDEDPWWRRLAAIVPTATSENVPRIIARLPFGPAPVDQYDRAGALVIAQALPELTGDDKTYVVIDLNDAVSVESIRTSFADMGMDSVLVARWQEGAAPYPSLLLEVSAFLTPDDEKIAALLARHEGKIQQAIVLGGYATPWQEAADATAE